MFSGQIFALDSAVVTTQKFSPLLGPPNLCDVSPLGNNLFNSQAHNLHKLKYLSLEEVNNMPFQQ